MASLENLEQRVAALESDVGRMNAAMLAVVAAWTTGTVSASTIRQEKLREWWPALAEALDEATDAAKGKADGCRRRSAHQA